MALLINLTTDSGIDLTNAYAKIAHFGGDKNEIHYQVDVFLSEAARDAGKQPVKGEGFHVTLPTGNDILPLLYADLKTRTGYTDGVDA